MSWVIDFKSDDEKMYTISFPEEAEAREQRKALIDEGFDCGQGIRHVPDREVEE